MQQYIFTTNHWARHLIWLLLPVIIFFSACSNSSKKGSIPEEDQAFQNPHNPQLNALTEAILESPDNAEYYFKRANVYYQEKIYRLALNDITQAIHLENNNPLYYTLLANIYKSLNKDKLALKVAKQAEGLGSQDAELYILMAQIYFNLNDKKNAEFYLSQSAILAPLHSEIFVLKGNVLAKNGDTLGALRQYRTALAKDRENVDAMKELAKIYDAKKLYDSSMVFIVSGKIIDRDEPYFDYLQGKVMEHMSLPSAAKTSYEAALANDSNFFLAALQLGNLYYRNSNLNEAYKWFKYSLRYDNDLPLANLHVAEIYELSGRGWEAIPYYERVSLIDTTNSKAKTSLLRLYNLYPDRGRYLNDGGLEATLLLANDTIKTAAATQAKIPPPTRKKTSKPTTKAAKPATEVNEAPVQHKEIVKEPSPVAASPKEGTGESGKKEKKKIEINLKSLFKKKKNKDPDQNNDN